MVALFSCPKGGVIIATTRLIAMHQNKGKSIADCLADRTDYAKNPEKTNEGELLSSYECDPITVQGEFMLSKRQYDDITGRKQASNVIAYQIRQSFKPGEITPELANKIGYELGMSVFCKYFLDKVAKHFWTLLHVQIGQSCKALASHDQTSHLMPCRHF